MAKATTLKFSQFLILIGDGGSPQGFGDPCGLTSRGFNRTAEMNDTNTPDCDDPDAPSWLERDVVSLAGEMTGSGVVAEESIDTWDEWFESGESRDVRIELNTRVWEGRAKLSQFNITGERGQRVNVEVTIVSDGPIIRTST